MEANSPRHVWPRALFSELRRGNDGSPPTVGRGVSLRKILDSNPHFTTVIPPTLHPLWHLGLPIPGSALPTSTSPTGCYQSPHVGPRPLGAGRDVATHSMGLRRSSHIVMKLSSREQQLCLSERVQKKHRSESRAEEASEHHRVLVVIFPRIFTHSTQNSPSW